MVCLSVITDDCDVNTCLGGPRFELGGRDYKPVFNPDNPSGLSEKQLANNERERKAWLERRNAKIGAKPAQRQLRGRSEDAEGESIEGDEENGDGNGGNGNGGNGDGENGVDANGTGTNGVGTDGVGGDVA